MIVMNGPGRAMRSRKDLAARASAVLATRKPALLFRFSVLFLLRAAARSLLGLLFQEPPRKTRQGAVQGA
jgi:hypothetical protein